MRFGRHKRSREEVEEAIKSTENMIQAAASMGLGIRQFKRIAVHYALYIPTRSGAGIKKELTDILSGKHPEYGSSKLSIRLVESGLKQYRCEGKDCGISDWRCNRIGLELNHIDGNGRNHSLENLELLCPNCHSQTDTYRSKKLLIGK